MPRSEWRAALTAYKNIIHPKGPHTQSERFLREPSIAWLSDSGDLHCPDMRLGQFRDSRREPVTWEFARAVSVDDWKGAVLMLGVTALIWSARAVALVVPL